MSFPPRDMQDRKRPRPAPRKDRGAPGEIPRRGGFTFIEMMLSLTITAMTIVVLGGLVLAVQTGRQQVEGEQETLAQGTASLERIRYMVGHAGTYRLPGQPTTLGLRVVDRVTSTTSLPEILVVWSGGRTGGMAALGELDRLPAVSELIVYAPSTSDPATLVEYGFSNFSGTIDFRGADFDSTIHALVLSPMAEKVELCDRMKWGSTISASDASYGEWASGRAASCVRFHLTSRPSVSARETTAPGTAAWKELPWAHGSSSSTSGLVQANLEFELTLWPRLIPLPPSIAAPTGGPGASADAIASADRLRAELSSIPFLGSVARRYVYTP